MATPLTFRSRLAQGVAALTAVVALVSVVAFVGESGLAALPGSLAPAAFVVSLAWAVFWRPRAEVSDSGITLVNVARTVRVPWRRFRSADTRWALSITTTGGRTFTSWAVPAGSGFGARLAPTGRWSGSSSADRKLASSGTAEAAAFAIGERVRSRRSKNETSDAVDQTGSGEVTTSANTTVLIVLGALAALTALSLALG